MQRASINYIVDLLTLLVLLGIAGTGLIMKFALPPGSGGAGLALWSLGRHDWGSIHFWLSAGMGMLLLVHLYLHWSWVCVLTNRLMHPFGKAAPPAKGTQRRAGVVALLLLVGGLTGFTLAARALVKHDAAAAGRHERQEQADRPGGANRGRAP
ncbi:MAG: DUF4405 domain-containing protein [Leptolyngbya sp. PLA3]|nr:MAG: DUF4405 domain-containing protein [Cyanobacteria bacterium CYA]MCE7968789.1 DUF4405 domain-containing protein [Leptolyngbya sp. PL-A3]